MYLSLSITVSTCTTLLRLDLFHRNRPPTTNSINANRAIPAPIPAFAPLERPPGCFELSFDSAGGGVVDGEFVGAEVRVAEASCEEVSEQLPTRMSRQPTATVEKRSSLIAEIRSKRKCWPGWSPVMLLVMAAKLFPFRVRCQSVLFALFVK